MPTAILPRILRSHAAWLSIDLSQFVLIWVSKNHFFTVMQRNLLASCSWCFCCLLQLPQSKQQSLFVRETRRIFTVMQWHKVKRYFLRSKCEGWFCYLLSFIHTTFEVINRVNTLNKVVACRQRFCFPDFRGGLPLIGFLRESIAWLFAENIIHRFAFSVHVIHQGW